MSHMSNTHESHPTIVMEPGSMTSSTCNPTYHPEFMPYDGSDIALISLDSIKFCTNSVILKNASGIFCTTLSLPQPPEASASDIPEICLSEDAQTICAILKMISGMALPALDTFDEVEKVLAAAHKWEMHGPISIIQRITMCPALLDDPLRLYILGCEFGWGEAAKVASALAHNLDMRQESFKPLLKRMGSEDLLRLQELRLRRRDGILEFLQKYNWKFCPHGDTDSHHSRRERVPRERDPLSHGNKSLHLRWEAVKWKLFLAMDVRPSEESIIGAIKAEMQGTRGAASGGYNCSKCINSGNADGWKKLMEDIKIKLCTLPQTI